jgi:hypothetical protein
MFHIISNIMTWTFASISKIIDACTNILTNSFTTDTNAPTSMDQVPNASNNIEAFEQITTTPTQAQLSTVADSDVPSPAHASKSTRTKLADNSTIMTHMGVLHVPTGCHVASFKAFVDLPLNDTHCDRVDLKTGLWFYCSVCHTEVKSRSDRPFTIGRWNEHIKSGSAHSKRVMEIDQVASIREKRKSGKVCTSIEYDI